LSKSGTAWTGLFCFFFFMETIPLRFIEHLAMLNVFCCVDCSGWG